MKFRNGFVSNSSSSSFLIIGADTSTINKEELENLLNNGCCSSDNESVVGFEYCVWEDTEREIDIQSFFYNICKIKNIAPNCKIKMTFGSRGS